jgi:hypothetical protein
MGNTFLMKSRVPRPPEIPPHQTTRVHPPKRSKTLISGTSHLKPPFWWPGRGREQGRRHMRGQRDEEADDKANQTISRRLTSAVNISEKHTSPRQPITPTTCPSPSLIEGGLSPLHPLSRGPLPLASPSQETRCLLATSKH